MLLFASSQHLGEELAKTFGSVPYHFRPLTEFLYFGGAFRLFGLNATPYHVISLLIHMGNTLLVYFLLRNLRLAAPPALVATAFFGLNVAWIHVVGWITCIQQLLPQMFMLLTLLFAVRAMRFESRRMWALSIVAYVFVLFSYEQQFLAPGLIFLIAVLGIGDLKRLSIRNSIRKLWPYFLILAVYIAVRLFWKGIPDEGRAKFVYGLNIADNFMTYLGGLYVFWPDVTALIARRSFDFRMGHVVLIAMVVYQLQAGRWRDVVFAFAFIIATLLPTVFLVRHYFYYHTYAASFGAIYLLALGLQDLFAWASQRQLKTVERQLSAAAFLIVFIAVVSFWRVRAIETKVSTERDPTRVSFVLHRARLAANAYRDVRAKIGDASQVREIQLLYGQPGAVTGKAYMPLVWALAHGKAINLFFDDPEMTVSVEPRDNVDPATFETAERRLLYYDLIGNFYTPAEILAGRHPPPGEDTHTDEPQD